ncbi:hypothetical protein ACXPVS_11450 [Pseudomonas sp. Ma2-10]
MKYVYAAVSSQREGRRDLSLVYYRIMRELAAANGVPFGEIDEGEPRLALPAELISISEKLMAYAQGISKTSGLSSQEESCYSSGMFISPITGTPLKIEIIAI